MARLPVTGTSHVALTVVSSTSSTVRVADGVLGLADADGESEADGETLGLTLDEGETEADGESEALGLRLGDSLDDGETEGDSDDEGESEADGETLALGETDGLTDDDPAAAGRIIRCTAPHSSTSPPSVHAPGLTGSREASRRSYSTAMCPPVVMFRWR